MKGHPWVTVEGEKAQAGKTEELKEKAKDHYFVYKEDTDERTVTRIRKMNKEERVKEIARMLSGASLTSASIANAKELLKAKN